jgi:hypothetical protein
MTDLKQKGEYAAQRQWSDYFVPKQQEIIEKYKQRLDFKKINKAYAFKYDRKEDMERNTDLLIYEYNSLRIALRVRNIENCKWRDITIRSYNKGYKTELDKINEGFGDYMLYCWGLIDKNNQPIIKDYLLFDLDLFRQRHDYFLEESDKPNKDGTKFNIYNTTKIIYSECSVVGNMQSLIRQEVNK